jgi:hypothetical protein
VGTGSRTDLPLSFMKSVRASRAESLSERREIDTRSRGGGALVGTGREDDGRACASRVGRTEARAWTGDVVRGEVSRAVGAGPPVWLSPTETFFERHAESTAASTVHIGSSSRNFDTPIGAASDSGASPPWFQYGASCDEGCDRRSWPGEHSVLNENGTSCAGSVARCTSRSPVTSKPRVDSTLRLFEQGFAGPSTSSDPDEPSKISEFLALPPAVS